LYFAIATAYFAFALSAFATNPAFSLSGTFFHIFPSFLVTSIIERSG